MAAKPLSEQEQPIAGTGVQQGVLEQAQAAATANFETSRPAEKEAVLQETDLVTPDGADEQSPPAYGDIYGEICAEKDGLGTSAHVTDDGRVNIRINQLNRRLSQVFIPALRQQDQSVEDSQPLPAPYLPPSLGVTAGLSPPPPLNIVIQVVGSRGDVQPFVALGKVLRETYGHRVRLATHPNFKRFVEENGLEFFSIGGDPSQLMAFMVKNPGLMPGARSVLRGDVRQRKRDVAEYIQGCWRSCYKAGDGMDSCAADEDSSSRPFVADCIIANPPSFAHIHCAEKLGIPLHIMFTMPYSPTQAFPHPLANISSSNADPQLTNYISYAMIDILTWQGLGDIINRFRANCLGLDPVSLIWAPGMLERLKVPHTYCWSPALIPKAKDWGSHISISGFYFLNLASQFNPARDLQAFLDAGPPPVYIGFGSIVLDDPNAMTELIFKAAKKSGQRILLSKGWGGMGADELRIPEDVFLLGNVPHDWLFKQVSCVVHHGGAGTTAAGITAGRPTLVVPFFGDQPFWGAMVSRAGAGPDPIPHKQLTAERLADAISFCLRPESLERAKALASKIAAEQGSDTGAQFFHQYLQPDRLRCTLAPERAAVWRVRRTRVKLSAFAACTLANANLLDFHDLKLFRAQEYPTDEGPWDPVSGGAAALFGSLSSMFLGVADFPSETWKALRFQSAPRRQQSQTTSTRGGKVADTARRSEGHSTPDSSNIELPMQDHMISKYDSGSRPHVTSRKVSSSIGNDDRVLHTTAHTSKGFGRIVKAALQAPMDMSVGITKGFHNAPKLWGDETVRPQEQVSDLKSGFKAIGKEFGYGFYDGVTGLFTQPWKGAQKEGAGGFFKGVGKGVGGFATKPGAALFSVPSYFMKGAYKEVQKLYGSSVQNSIIASRTTQGYEEWMQSPDEEKEDVIVRWKLIQKYLKKKRDPDEMIEDMLEAQRTITTEDREARRNSGRYSTSTRTSNGRGDATQLSDINLSTMCSIRPPSHSADLTGRRSQESATAGEGSRMSIHQTPVKDAFEGPQSEGVDANILQHLSSRPESVKHQSNQEALQQAIASSEAESRRHASDALEYERQLSQAMEQSLREQRLHDSCQRPWESSAGTSNIDEPELDEPEGTTSAKPRFAR